MGTREEDKVSTKDVDENIPFSTLWRMMHAYDISKVIHL